MALQNFFKIYVIGIELMNLKILFLILTLEKYLPGFNDLGIYSFFHDHVLVKEPGSSLATPGTKIFHIIVLMEFKI